ncbi:12661_t:CDS:1, partial [Cetraspora pellucida]
MSLTNLQNLALNILKETKHNAVQNIDIIELSSYKICNKKILTINFESLTILSCDHVYYKKCIEKNFLFIKENKCLITECKKTIDLIIFKQRFSKSSQSNETSVIADMLGNNLRLYSPINTLLFEGEIQKKHVREPTNKPSNKKVKKLVKKESDILEDLIKELSTEPKTQVPVIRKENVISFNDLYNNITNSEMQNEITNRDVITNYYLFGKALSEQLKHHEKTNPPYASLLLVNKEVREQIPNITDTTLWKK